MQDPVFKGDVSRLANVDVDAPLANVKIRCCDYYVTPYQIAAQQAEERGDVDGAAAYRFLQALVSFSNNFDNPQQPFVPRFQMAGSRGLIPSDVSPDDVTAVRELAKLTKDPALRSRLYDVVWELTRDHMACAEAAASYIDAAEVLNTADLWVDAAPCYQRGLYLASKLGRSKDLFKRLSETLQQSAQLAAQDSKGFRSSRYIELLIRFGCVDPVVFAPIAAAIAEKAYSDGEPHRARAYREIEADLHGIAGNAEAEKHARLAAAETYVQEAEGLARGKGGSAMAAASILTGGIEALRRAGAPPERVEEVRRLLKNYQTDSLQEMKATSTEVDIAKLVEAAREHVRSPDLHDALFKFAFGDDLTDPRRLRDSVRRSIEEHPITRLFPAAILDGSGRTIARRESLLHVEGEALEQELEREMFSEAAHFHWPIRVSGYITPARLEILNNHLPTFSDLVFLVRDNPFVPPGHEGIFGRGIHAGFHGDFVLASHLLVPQIENSLRYVLESQGVDVSNLMSDGTQPVKVLGALLGMAQTKEILGDALCFELRGCLIEKTGYDFRNRVAHGFVSEGECYSPAAITAWWLVVRMCLTPIWHALVEQRRDEASASNAEAGQADKVPTV